MKPIISIYLGHDVSLSVYDPVRDDIIVLEFEKITGIKHYNTARDPIRHNDELLNVKTIDECLRILENQFDIDNDFSYLITNFDKNVMDFWSLSIEFDRYIISSCHHHAAHGLSSYIQSPYTKAVCLSWDGGGDDTCFMVTAIDQGSSSYIDNTFYYYGGMYNAVAQKCPTFKTTPLLDVAGKAMGFSAYGKFDPNLIEIYRKLSCVDIPEEINNKLRDICNKSADITVPITGLDYKIRNFKTLIREIFPSFEVKDEKDTIFTMQKFLESEIANIIERDYLSHIEQHDNNLILSGGTALNVLVNEHLRNKFPHINIFVAPNPGDVGLSIGHLYYFLTKNNFEVALPKKLTYAGAYLQDLDRLNDYKKNFYEQEISIKELANVLKEGKIIGLLQGRHELGPRALGNRSILCDPSIPGMKDTLNSKVKFREWYRPFAPVCRKEDSSKYFTTASFENMEFMSFTAKVNEEHKERLAAITHVDGTARLQTVTQESNKFLYDLLTEFDGVLLNTSFNVQGEPTLNKIRKAFEILHKTELDGFVLVKDEKIFLYSLEQLL